MKVRAPAPTQAPQTSLSVVSPLLSAPDRAIEVATAIAKTPDLDVLFFFPFCQGV